MKIRVWQIQTRWIFSRFCHSTSPLETLTPVEWGIRTFKFYSATTLLLFTEILKNWRLLEQQPARLNSMVIHRAIRWGVVLRLNAWFCDCLKWLINHKPKEAPLTGLPLISVPFAEFKSLSITEVPETSSLACQRLTSTSSNTSWLLSGLRPIATVSCCLSQIGLKETYNKFWQDVLKSRILKYSLLTVLIGKSKAFFGAWTWRTMRDILLWMMSRSNVSA